VPLGGRIASWLLGAAWSVATIFAVPVIALEGCRAPGCLKRSAELVRTRWGESLAGTVTITAIAGVASFVPAFFLVAGVAAMQSQPASGIVLAGIGITGLMLVVGASSAVREIFSVALYRYATDGEARGGFPEADLRAPFTEKKKR
jgi:hypothetical protein